MDIQKEFTDHALNRGWCVDGESTPNGYLFYSAQTNDRWIGWQAAKSQVVPEGFVLMPIKPTEKHLKAIYDNKNSTANAYRAMIETQEQSHD